MTAHVEDRCEHFTRLWPTSAPGRPADAPLFLDGFITRAELAALQKAGAVAEIVGWAYDADGRLVEGLTNDRVVSAPLPSRETALVVALAKGDKKLPGIRAALSRRLVNGILTDEYTAAKLLESPITR